MTNPFETNALLKGQGIFAITKGGPGSGPHANAANHLRELAAKADAGRNSPRLRADVLGRTHTASYGNSGSSNARMANYRIGREASDMANRIEGDTSKSVSDHLADVRDSADSDRANALQNSMYDNYSTAQMLRERADTKEALADHLEKNGYAND